MTQFDIDAVDLPVLPTDDTPETVSGTPSYLLIGPVAENEPAPAAITLSAAALEDAAALAVTALPRRVYAGTVLDFNGIQKVVTVDALKGATAITTEASGGALANGAATQYTPFRRVPLAEEFGLDLADDTEKIKVHGRITPLSSKNGIDADGTVKTVAGLSDPVVEDLIEAGMTLSRAKRTVIFIYNDGFAVAGRFLIGAPKPDNKTGAAQRYDIKLMLASKLFWANLRKTGADWKEVK